MYYPYFRGKQYELITIRESASTLKNKNFVPIIEPVRIRLTTLKKTLDVLCEEGTKSILITNPQVGEYSEDHSDLTKFFSEEYSDKRNITQGLLLTQETSIDDAIKLINELDQEVALIHNGFTQAEELSRKINGMGEINTHVFFENRCGKLYQKHFKDHSNRILIRDGFESRRNSDYPQSEFFSELHETFGDEGMNGFGDFLIVGSQYREVGGPAYAVAIHLTYIDATRNNEMHIRHFKSDRQDTPVDPAGKFYEALSKLVAAVEEKKSDILDTPAVDEFKSLYEDNHFRGLGYVKKLSMLHHIETLSNFF